MSDYDLIVVGAGPAGATAARLAAEAGLRTAIFERAAFPREKLCGGFVSAKALDALGVSIPEAVVERSIEAVEIRHGEVVARAGSGGRRRRGTEGGAGRPALLGITVRRAAFDAHLLECARDAGAEVFQPAHVRRVIPQRGETRPAVEFSLGATRGEVLFYRAAAIVDARGVASLVGRRGPFWALRRYTLGFSYGAIVPSADGSEGTSRRAEGAALGTLGAPGTGHPAGTGTSAALGTGRAAARSDPQAPPSAATRGTLILDEHPVRAGFGWAFPFEGSYNVGVGAWTPARRGLKETYQDYLEKLIRDAHVSPSSASVRPRAALLPPGGVPYRMTGGGVLYVGDAAGMIDPYGGEGIYGAVQSGRLAAQAAVAGLRPGEQGPDGQRRGRHARGGDGGLQSRGAPSRAPAARARSVCANYRLLVRGELTWELRFAFARAGLAWLSSWRRPSGPRLRRTAELVAEVMQNPRANRNLSTWLSSQCSSLVLNTRP